MYQPPSPAPPWSYAPPDCPTEGSSLRRQQVPGYSPPQVRGRALARPFPAPLWGWLQGLWFLGHEKLFYGAAAEESSRCLPLGIHGS